MVIVSQDKKIITNFDNILAIQIEDHISNNDGEKDYEIKIITEKRDCIIAIYETEERAEEILEDITRLYRKNFQVIGERGGVTGFIYPPKVYQMPKE